MKGDVVHGSAGTIQYMAPEIRNNESYLYAIDMWSFGVTVYLLLSGQLPFSKTSNSKIGAFSFAPDCRASGLAQQFVRELLEVDPNKRLTAAGALEHTWVSNEQ